MNATTASPATAASGKPMGILTVLAAPRYATSRATRWTSFILFILLAGVALAIGMLKPDPRLGVIALIVYSLGLGCLWLLWLSGLLLLARDARRLRLAHLVRNTTLAAVVYALACVAAPVILMAATGGDTVLAVLYPACAIAATLAFVLLPRYISSWFGLLPAFYIGLHNIGWMPSPLDPRFQRGAWIALAVFMAVVVWRWRQLLRTEDNDASGWRSAMLMQLRQNLVLRDWGFDRQWDLRRSGKRPTAVDLHDVGPGNPAKAIRVVLGGWYLPQTPRARLESVARVVLPLLLLVPILWLMNIGHADSLAKAWHLLAASIGLWLGVFGAFMLALASAGIIHRRWRQHANMALLALTPGLGGDRATAHASRAILGGPVGGFVLLWLCLALPTPLQHQHPMPVLLGSLCIVALAALLVVYLFRTLLQRPFSLFAKIAIGVVLMVVADASFIFATVASDGHWHAGLRAEWWTVLAWLALIAWAAWQAFRAWRALQLRAHPFLTNAPQ